MSFKHRRYVYKLTFPNGMLYFGSTYSVEERWSNNGRNYCDQSVYAAIEEFGWENIRKEVVLFLSNNDNLIKNVEKALIKEHKSICYNCKSNPIWDKTHKAAPMPTAGYIHVWTIDEVTKPAKEWCEIYGKCFTSVLGRIRTYGMTPKEALTCPNVPKCMNRKALKYWEGVGVIPGTDTTSYITPLEEYPYGIVARQ